jgi:1,4-alpha-glucan branching enzyme
MYEDPRPTPPLPQGAVVSFGVLTAQKFAGGRLYAWNPGGSESGSFAESARDAVRGLSTFAVTLDRWMTGGFHFKLVTAGGKFEPESCNRYWRPADGTTPYLKAGQVALHPACPEPVLTPITVTMPAASTQPTLLIRDEVDDFHAELAPVWTREIDAQFVACRFERSIYPQARYLARIKTAAYDPGYDLPLVVGATQGGAPERFGVLGVSEWLAAQPVRDAAVTLVVHPNPKSGFPDEIEVPWRIGRPPQTRFEPPGVPGGTAMAKRGPDGSWAASLELFGGVPQYFDLLRTPGGLTESRADGPVLSQRAIRPAADETSVHTIDGQSGLSTRGPLEFADPAFDQRAALMRRAFSPEIADAGTFAPHELPHGATWNGEDLWFVLFAPHAVRVELVLLDRAASTPAGRVTREHALRLTSDLRYWWCKVARAELPDPENVEYRFLLDGTTEVLDPASRAASEAEYVWPERGEGPHAAWSIAVNRDGIVKIFEGTAWQTPRWNELMIFELHARRLTQRNKDERGDTLAPFGQVEAELLRPNGYLARFPVTAVELLPANEFPKYISWGYNSSLYFAIESSYGGPDGFARVVKAAHDAGKAVLLDVVYNHLTDSPMQATARDVFVDGETQWGDMVNYDHPVCREFFRQSVVYLWDTFRLDGYRLDATEAIVNGHVDNGYIIRNGHVGSGGGWQFLTGLREALERAASACKRQWPYLVAENKPNNWGIDGFAADGQWDFTLESAIAEAAACRGDAAFALANDLRAGRPAHEVVHFNESHDSVAANGNSDEQRIAMRGPWGVGMRMAKACGALVFLAKGIPMCFMGAEAAETAPFSFGVQDAGEGVLDLDRYERPGTENQKVLTWFRDVAGLRRNWANGFGSDGDAPNVGNAQRTIAFSRDGGHFFVVATFGTADRQQRLGDLGLPEGAYKESFNSTWPQYRVDYDADASNGGYTARLSAASIVNLPEVGAVIFERA